MKYIRIVFFSLLLLVTMLACSVVSNLIATPTPLPLPAPASVLFEDGEFSDSCSIESTADVERFVENGQFNMRVITSEYVGWTECTTDEFSDIIVEVDATQLAGPNNNLYGIIFRYGLQAKDFYVFAISGDGYYIFAVDGAEHTEPDIIVDWTESSAIKQGQQTNRLKVAAVGNSIKYYVNDQLLGESQDDRFTTGTVGFFTGSVDEGGVHISFDNLKISEP